MLKRTNQNAKSCYERAVTAAQQAANARTPMDRNFWLDRERTWIALAASYDYQERCARFVQELRFVCDVPTRVNERPRDGLNLITSALLASKKDGGGD